MIAATDTLRKELAPINDIEVVIKGGKSLWIIASVSSHEYHDVCGTRH